MERVNANGLSHLPLPTEKSSRDSNQIFNVRQLRHYLFIYSLPAQDSCRDPTLSQVLHYTRHGWPSAVTTELKPFWTRQAELTLEEDCVLWGMRVIIPQKLQKRMLDKLHQSHVGITRLKSIARSYV